jgi:hypothetical protein
VRLNTAFVAAITYRTRAMSFWILHGAMHRPPTIFQQFARWVPRTILPLWLTNSMIGAKGADVILGQSPPSLNLSRAGVAPR